ncbi:uncharacterized protein LOC143257244 [Tachypleus tridentatus]|uniref:uncharacterized protein LOC143257244 n=1 Tax=Tachypleus tridentatus TaxID=6853 RepID=UPI003FD4806B
MYSAVSGGGSHDRTENGDTSGSVVGSYSLTHEGGSRRKVDYTAGGAGFKATVYTNEQGIIPGEDPADVSIFAFAGDDKPTGAAGGAEPSGTSDGASGGARTPFDFMYSAVSGGGLHGRTESGDASGKVVGSYSLTHKGGSRRKVDYTADGAGFKATVYTNEQGMIPGEDPADVSILALAGDAVEPAGAAGAADGAVEPSGGSHTPFNFMYNAAETGGASSRSETGDESGNVKGSYSVEDPDGRRRKVDYTAGTDGFKAKIHSNEPGVEPGSNPADVDISGYAGLPMIPAGGPAAAPAAGAPADTGIGGGPALPFTFMYSAAEIGGASSRSETGDESGNVKGSYSVEDPDGRRRKVDYTAGTDGFKAKIHSNEPGVEPGSNPADVDISGYAGLPMIPAGGPAAAPADASAADAPVAGAPAAGAPVGGPFEFMYTAPAGGGSSSRSESGEGGRKVTGSYSVEHPSGQKRLVDYSAGDLGFTATIKSNEQGVKPGDDPASVSILSLPGVPAAPAPAAAPAPVAEPSPFSFMYTAEGDDGTSSRSESGTVGGEITGSYSLTIGDGRKRVVDYSAGSAGFKPNIQSNEQGVSPGDNPADTTIVGLPGGAPVGPVGGYAVSHVPAAAPAPVPVAGPVGPVSSYAVLHAPGAFAGPVPADIPASLGEFAPGAISARDLFEAAKYAPVSLSKVGGSPWYR